MKLSAAGLSFIKSREGFFSRPYDDGVGVRTIGYGTTEADVRPLPASLTEPQAAALLKRKLDTKYEPVIRRLFAKGGPLHGYFNQNRYDALVSFVYNLGTGAVPYKLGKRWVAPHGFETLGRAIIARDMQRIANALPLYSNPNTPSVHAGLLARRNAERSTFLRVAFSEYELGLLKRRLTPLVRFALKAQARKVQISARAAGGWNLHSRSERFRALRKRAAK